MTAPGVRERNRRDLTAALLDAARRQLAEVGAAALSLRGVAREVGMVPSAVYRYFAGRDELITALLLDSYGSLAAAVEAAEAAAASRDTRGRWRAICTAIRAWGVAHPHEWSLLYGSPVPGYRAPEATVEPVERIAGVFGRVLAAVAATEPGDPPARLRRTSPQLRQDLETLRRSGLFTPAGGQARRLTDAQLLQGLGAWVQVFGLVSFELFGQFRNVVEDLETFFDVEVDLLYRTLAGR